MIIIDQGIIIEGGIVIRSDEVIQPFITENNDLLVTEAGDQFIEE